MLGSLRKFALLGGAVALAGLAGQAVPSTAHPDPNPTNLTCVVAASPATVSNATPHSVPSPGLFYPVTDPQVGHLPLGDDFSWTFSGRCLNNGLSFSSSGVGKGYCGRSVGTGAGTVGGHTYTVSWQSGGSQLVLTHPSAVGSVNAQPNPPGSPRGSCANGTAIEFLVDGDVSHLG